MQTSIFSISNGKIIARTEVATIAAKFWGADIPDNWIVAPKPGADEWYAVLCLAVNDLQYFKEDNDFGNKYSANGKGEYDMRTVAAAITFQAALFNGDLIRYDDSLDYYRPYVGLCYHLSDMGIAVKAI